MQLPYTPHTLPYAYLQERGDCLQCFATVAWASGRAFGLSDEVLVLLSVWSEVQIVCIWSSDATASPNPIISCLIKI